MLTLNLKAVYKEKIGKFASKITSENIVRLFKPLTNVNYNFYMSNAIG